MSNEASLGQRYRGALLGLAIGDAIGASVEFEAPGTFPTVTGMTGGGPFGLKVGEWTDDTSMALCLAESLLECQGFNPSDQLARYCMWYRNGHLSSTGTCFDIGMTVRGALVKFKQTKQPYCGSADPRSAGNGSIMRLAPIPMYYAKNPTAALNHSALSSRTTHAAVEAVDACRYFGGLIVGALIGVPKDVLLAERYSPAPECDSTKLATKIDEIACGLFKHKNPPEIRGTGYVVNSLEASLWSFYRSSTFAEGCLLAANLGNDADTTAAVYGQLAGAYYGEASIPHEWRKQLAHRPMIEQFADRLFQSAGWTKV